MNPTDSYDGNLRDSSVNPRELEYYSALASTWWNPDGPFWPLHKLNSLRVAYIRDELCRHFDRDARASRPLDGLRVLDVGCGGGILSESMAALGAGVTGIDVVAKNIHVASLHAGDAGLPIDYRVVTAESLASEGKPFDVVLNMEVVEHVADLDAFMRACNGLVRPGGLMFISTINRTPLAWLFAIVGAEYILRWLPKGTHRWQDFRRPRELERLLADGGLEIRDRTGVAVNPLTRKFRLNTRLTVNYMLLARRKVAA